MTIPTYHTVHIEETGASYRCAPTETLLRGMEHLGRRGIPVGCRGGGCGVCKIEIVAGHYTSRVMSREYVSEAEEGAGRVLACRVYPLSDIRLRVLGKMSKNVCRPLVLGQPPGGSGAEPLVQHLLGQGLYRAEGELDVLGHHRAGPLGIPGQGGL